jgi:predicted DCC family thiol-disulfide oxidoreductase YuxK
MRTKAIHVVYDGQCAFCIRSLRLFRALDLQRVFRFYNAHDERSVANAFPELKNADFDNAMFAVTEDREVYRGFFAFRRMIWASPLMWWMIPIFYFPGAAFFGVRIYAWVARNRLKFGCRSESCVLPGAGSPDSHPLHDSSKA